MRARQITRIDTTAGTVVITDHGCGVHDIRDADSGQRYLVETHTAPVVGEPFHATFHTDDDATHTFSAERVTATDTTTEAAERAGVAA